MTRRDSYAPTTQWLQPKTIYRRARSGLGSYKLLSRKADGSSPHAYRDACPVGIRSGSQRLAASACRKASTRALRFSLGRRTSTRRLVDRLGLQLLGDFLQLGVIGLGGSGFALGLGFGALNAGGLPLLGGF